MTRHYDKWHYVNMAHLLNTAQTVAGKDPKGKFDMTPEQTVKAFKEFCNRLIDTFTLDSDLFDEKKFREAAWLDE